MHKIKLRIQVKMKWILLLICSPIFLLNYHDAYSFVYLDSLPDSKPKRIMVDQKDRFYIDYNNRISVVSDKLEYSVHFRDAKENFSSRSYDTEVSPDGKIVSLVESTYTPKKSKTTYYRLNIAECIDGTCHYRLLASWSSGKSSTYYYAVGKLGISKKGEAYFNVTRHYKSGKKWLSDETYYVNTKKVSVVEYQQIVPSKNVRNKSGVEFVDENGFTSDGISFTVNGKAVKHSEGRSSRYTRSIILDENENPHVFFHDPVTRSYYHHFYSPEQKKIIEIQVDDAESGGENVLFILDDEIWSIHYFYRDSFNKGMLVSVHDAMTGELKDKFVFDASEIRNAGWDMLGAQSSNNRILLTYISNKVSNSREYLILDSVKGLKSEIGENFTRFGHPKGEGFLQYISKGNRNEHIRLLNSSYAETIRSDYLNIGFGVQNVNWIVNSAVPDEDSNVATPYDPEYTLTASILSSVSIEGKYGSMNFGLDYATKLIDKEVEKSSSSNAKAFNKIMGKIGWERLIFNYDFAFQYEQTNSEVLFTDKSGQISSRTFDIEFREMKFSLLNMKRYHFGYIYQDYNFYQPVYIYKILKDSKVYSFFSQAIGDIKATNHLFHYGKSTVNYITKYETKFNNWFIDWELRAGLSQADFEDNIVLTGNKKPSKEFGFIFAGQLEVGYIWYKRWKSFYQIGGVIKLSYRVDASKIGDSKKPEDKETAATSDEYTYQFERTEIRHGPMVFVSLNF